VTHVIYGCTPPALITIVTHGQHRVAFLTAALDHRRILNYE